MTSLAKFYMQSRIVQKENGNTLKNYKICSFLKIELVNSFWFLVLGLLQV